MTRSWGDIIRRVLGVAVPATVTLGGLGADRDALGMALIPDLQPVPKRLEPLAFVVPHHIESLLVYTGHRSHSSHASHSSHSSHYSSAGGTYTPTYPSTPPASVAPSPLPAPTSVAPNPFGSPTPLAPRPTKASPQDARIMTMRAQLELMNLGYYHGPIDGNMTAETKDALRVFQKKEGIGVTGTLDTPTLARLGLGM